MALLPKLKLKVVPTFPSTTHLRRHRHRCHKKTNGALTVDLDYDDFGVISSIPTSPTSYILTYDTATNSYVMVPAHLLGGGVSGIADAPVDGTDYVRNSANWQYPSFLQSGAGSVLRPMLAKARENFSVFDFGAVGDGVTDDGPAINMALAAAGSGTAVFFPARTASGAVARYLVDSVDITMPNGVQMSGPWHPGVTGVPAALILADLGGAIILNPLRTIKVGGSCGISGMAIYSA